MIEMANQLRWHADLTDFKTVFSLRFKLNRSGICDHAADYDFCVNMAVSGTGALQ